MADTWHDLARENRVAASILFRDGAFRSMISRAYYAVYSMATHSLVTASVIMPHGREGPSHKRLRPLIESNLPMIQQSQRRQALSRIVGALYTMRLSADYVPSDPIDSKEARAALALMTKAFNLLP